MGSLNSFVKHYTDQGVAVLVRWLGSQHGACCQAQAPAWNAVTKTFHGSPRIVFGDIDLQGADESGPDAFMLRWFSNETSLRGVACRKSTKEPTCEEFAERALLEHCVFEASGDALCGPDHREKCSEEQLAYLRAWEQKSFSELRSELFNEEKKLWTQEETSQVAAVVVARVALLKQLRTKAESAQEEVPAGAQ